MSIGQNTTHHTKKAADAGSDYIRAAEKTTHDAVQSGLDSASASARRFTDQITQACGLTGEGREELTRQGSQNLEMVAQASAVLTRGVQDLSREWFSLTQEHLQKNLDDFGALTRCRSLPDVMAAQSTLMRDNLEQTIESTRRIAEVATRVANEASQALTAQTKTAQRVA
jgi:phasin family protein